MTSPAQAAANAANAQLSTGPRTEAGKARSSRNALKHGLTAQQLVVRKDEMDAFNSLREDLLKELGPEGAIEMFTFKQLIRAAWNIERSQRLENDLFVNGLDPLLDDSAVKALDRIHRYHHQSERSYYRHLKELRVLQTNRALRNLKLSQETAKRVPPLVSYNDLTKRSQQQNQQQVEKRAAELAVNRFESQLDAFIASRPPKYLRNEPIAAGPAEENAA